MIGKFHLPERRRFQFSLRTMLWLTVVAALALVATTEHWRRLQLKAELEATRLEAASERQARVQLQRWNTNSVFDPRPMGMRENSP